MADLTFAPAAAAGIRQAPQTSIADMLNMARGVQEYQQAQQVNPLALQLKQLEAQRAQETTPAEIERQKSLSRQQLTSEESSNVDLQNKYANAAKAAVGGLIVSPFFQPEANKKYDSDKMLHELDTVERVLGAQGVKKHPHGAMDQLREIIKTDPSKAYSYLQTLAGGQLAPESQLNLTLPQAVEGGPGQPPTMRNKITGALEAAPIIQKTPPPSQPGQPAPEGAPVSTEPKPSPEFTKGMYKVRPAGDLSPYGPSEKSDETSGIAYRQRLLEEKQGLPRLKTNVDAVIGQVEELLKSKTPETGAIGAFKRKFAELVGDPQYQALEKDLANMVMATETAAGGSTDSGRALRQSATGKVGLAPEVLIDIARRAKADMINLDLQSDAADKFGTKFGDNNQKTFRKNWGNNAKTEIFRIMEIHDRLGKSPQAQAEVDALIGKMSPNELTKFQQKYRNIRSLIDYGYIPEEKAK
jgi:hypothetical protein